MLYNVFVECNQPQPPMGIKQWTARLTPEQRQVLTALPVAAPEHDSVAAGLRAAGNAMRTAGRAAVTACGGTWPVDLDEGVQRVVDQSVPAPRPETADRAERVSLKRRGDGGTMPEQASSSTTSTSPVIRWSAMRLPAARKSAFAATAD